MATNKKSVEFLPPYLQTDKNAKFLSSTIDPLIQKPELERIDGYVGTTDVPNFDPDIDNYLYKEKPVPPNNRLVPSLIFRDEVSNVKSVVTFEDLVNEIQNQGGDNSNLFKTLKWNLQTYDPLIDWDKFVNYDQYYWLPNGPDPITVYANPFNILGSSTFVLSTTTNLSNGMKVVFTSTYYSSSRTISSSTQYIVEGVGDYIHLIDFNSLEPNGPLSTNINEVFDNTEFDSFPFDSNKQLALTPEYITINKASVDLNPWTRYNRWFHKDVIKITAEINNKDLELDYLQRASRPIIEFRHNFQLFNFGKIGINNVDLYDDVTEFPLRDIPGNIGFYIDGVELEEGYRIIFGNCNDLYNRNKIYRTVFNTSTNLINLIETTDSNVSDLTSVSVNFGIKNSGKSFYYKDVSKKWVEGQQHTKHNQAPLFNLYDINGNDFSSEELENDFAGSKIFGYLETEGINDPVLGFPVKQSIGNLGIGGFIFKNYFYNDTFTSIENRNRITKYTRNGFYKFYGPTPSTENTLLNVWTFGGTFFNVPVEETYIVNESTNTFISKAFEVPLASGITAVAKINNSLSPVSASTTGTYVKYLTLNTVTQNSQVIITSVTSNTPTNRYYYEIPINLTTNPLNEGIDELTFSQMNDQLTSMINRRGIYTQLNTKGLRDFPYRGSNGYTSYGAILNQHQEPIVLPMIFLGNKDHNLIDALRWLADQYAQWRFNFLKSITNYNYQNDPIDVVDSVITELNQSKVITNNFFRSDMVPYGNAKTVRKITVTVRSINSYPIGIDFDLDSLSFKSVLIYLNSIQLIFGRDYKFNSIENTVEFIISLSLEDKIEIHVYNDTLGSFVPPSPTKLGMWPKYVPSLITDDRYSSGSQTVIQCHDGSLIKAFGDYRDAVILEFEKRIYNNIKVKYNTAYLGENLHTIPFAFLERDYTLDQYNTILGKEFHSWVTKYNVDWKKNTTYDKNNWKTWNFSMAKNNVNTDFISGNWRAIYKYFFDTDRPHTHPWEMLGLSVEPLWWKDLYGSAPYTSGNTLMWGDLAAGYVRGETKSQYVALRYARRGLTSRIPVDSVGNLRNPLDFLLQTATTEELGSDWEFGDCSPAELSWRNSSYYPFAVNIVTSLLYPNLYYGQYYDTSRIIRRFPLSEALVYSDDLLYVSPKRLKIDGIDGHQTAGYVNVVLEKGIRDNINYPELLSKDLKYLTLNLSYKLGGFTSKDKLQVKINAVDPESYSPGLLLSPEDYNLFLNVGNPIKVLRISGIVIEKQGTKFIVKGYDRYNPFFTIYKPVHTSNAPVLKIGGKDESYSLWQPTYDGNNGLSSIQIADAKKFYKQGQIVYHDGNYYRVTVSHVGQPTFNTAFFAKLAELPTTGGFRIVSSTVFENKTTKIYYNSEFNSVQEVYDLVIGYGKWLESEGFVFDYFQPDLNATLDWFYTGREFVFWATNNWADGNIIALSPFTEYLKISNNSAIVDNLFSKNYEYSLQKADGQSFPRDSIDITRTDGSCVILTKNTEEGIFFAELNLIQKEHALVINNTTIFNDTIYDPPSGYRQRRIKLSGFKTKNWNGDISSPGFFYDKFNIDIWKPYQTYYISQVVQYNSLYYSAKQNIVNENKFDFTKWKLLDSKPNSQILPNFDYKIKQFEEFYSLDIDNFDVGQQQLAQHLIGYSPRPYLSKIITDAIAQYKFYQGFIKEKGTRKAIDNIVKTGVNRNFSSIDIKEEWAFRVGSYGAETTFNEIEFPLVEGSNLENPYLIVLTDRIEKNSSGIIHYTTASDLLITPSNFVITSTFVIQTGTYLSNNLELTTAGYVRVDDVSATAFSKNSLLDIGNNSIIQDGDTVWLGFLENGGWDVYRYTGQLAKITGVYVSTPGSTITFVTDINHQLNVGDIISVVRFNNQVNGVYIVRSIELNNQFTVDSTLAGIVNEPLLNYGSLYKFESVRFANFQSLAENINLIRYNNNSKLWIDNNENEQWTVIEKISNFYTATEFVTSTSPTRQNFGFSIAVDGETVLVSSPSYNVSGSFHYGKISVFRKLTTEKIQNQFDYILNSKGQIYCKPFTSTEFGYSLAYDNEKDLYFVGAPAASDIRATTSTAAIVSLATTTNLPRVFSKEGLVKVSTKNRNRTDEVTKFVLARPYSVTGYNTTATIATHENGRFGHSIFINKVDLNLSTTLLVGAPGNDSYLGTGTVFAYKINGTGTSIVNFGTDSVASVSITTAPVSTLTVNVSFSSPNIPGGTTATGVLVKSGNTGTKVLITNRGTGYTSSPTVTFTGTNMTTIGSAISYVGFIELIGTYTTNLAVGSKWGASIAGSNSGDTIAVTAHKWFNFGVEGLVQLFDKDLYWKQTLDSPFGYNDEFGQSLAVSSSGKFIFVGSTKPLSRFNTYGKVAVYKRQDNGYFSLTQTLQNPIQNTDLKFGESIVVSPDEKTLVVSALGTNRSELVRFFENKIDLKGETTFDNKETRFVSVVSDSGAVYTYNNFDDYFIQAEELLPDELYVGGRYGKSLAVSNGSVLVGAPFNPISSTDIDFSRFYQFKLKNINDTTWSRIRQQEPTVDVETFKRICIINTDNQEVVEYLDVFDPVKNKIPGIAEQELRFKSASDPAIYSIGIANTNNDSRNSWIDDHIGELWWDLSTVKYLWYEQGNDIFRKNNWGKLFPGSSIDIYEWVKSDLLPSEWAVLADSPGGLAKGISGQPKYPDNSVVSVKQILNTITGVFDNVYYFWVKNKVVLPNIQFRRITAYEVSRLISDPLSYGLKFVNILSSNAVAFNNLQGDLIGKKISANITFDTIKNKIPRHTEWALVNEGDISTMPPKVLDQKLLDSLIGKDNVGNNVPDTNLSFRQRYGIGIRPRQSMFRDRFEAIRNCLSYANNILAKNRISSGYDFTRLNSFEPIPAESQGEYDIVLDDYDQLGEVTTEAFVRASLSCTVYNGKIIKVDINNPGYGYKIPPRIDITPNPYNLAEVTAELDNEGRISSVTIRNSGQEFLSNPSLTVRPHAVVIGTDVNSGNRWTIYRFEYNLRVWTKFRTQLFNTQLYWKYVDYKSESYNQYKSFRYTLTDIFELDKISEIDISDYVKILNSGDGNIIIIEKTIDGDFSTEYNVVYQQNATIEFLDSLWNLQSSPFDTVSLDETLYDQLPDVELKNILLALKEDLFIDELKQHWNLLFFKAVKYALTEQKFLDWAFKTSFVTVKNNISYLNTASAYSLDATQYIEDYIREIKPYRTQIRNFVSAYEYLEDTRIHNTDFDLPTYYSESFGAFTSTSRLVTDTTIPTIFNSYPYKDWTDNYKYFVYEVIIADGGSNYTTVPTVSFSTQGSQTTAATAKAYIRNGSVYKISVTSGGSGYDRTVYASLNGGGPNVIPAKLSVILKNEQTRKNIIGIKFDRYSRQGEIGELDVLYTTSTNGLSLEYELPYHAHPDKSSIQITLDKKLVLTNDYEIVAFTKDNNSFNKDYSKIVFTSYLPAANKSLSIRYRKNNNLLNAIDRISNFYQPTSEMPGNYLPLLMSGLEYPERQITGLRFDYSTTVTSTATIYDNGGGWNDFTSYYSRAKVIATATSSTTILSLNTVDGIVVGQVLNFLNTPDKVVRPDTVVIAVNTSSKTIQISSASYRIKLAISTSTLLGTNVEYETFVPFNGALRQGDVVEITGISASGFNGVTTISTVTSNKSFVAPSTGVLQVLSTSGNAVSNVRAYSLLKDIYPQNKLIGNYNTFVGPCVFSQYSLVSCSPSMMEGYTATWTLNGVGVEFGLGRTFWYYITGTNITSSDFVDGLTGVISTNATSLPLTFYTTSTQNVDTPSINTETFYVNIVSWLTTASSTSTKSVISNTMKLRDRPTGMATWSLIPKDLDGNIITFAREGDVVNFTIDGSNIDFASDGVSLGLTATGVNITGSDITAGILTITNAVRIYSEDELPFSFDIQFTEDLLTEGTEIMYFGLNVSTVTNCTVYSTTVTTTVTSISIIDTSLTQPSTYQLEALTPTVVEGSTATFRLKTTYVNVGTLVPFIITGTVSVSDLNTTTYTGTFIMIDGGTINPGGQFADISFNVASDAATTGLEATEFVSMTLTNKVSNSATIYIVDQLAQSYGNVQVYGYSVNAETAVSQIKIAITPNNTGTFEFVIHDSAQSLSTKPVTTSTTGGQIWALNTSLPNYYVRGIIEPTNVWVGTVNVTGPGFTNTVTYSSFSSGPVIGNWITVNTANSTAVFGNYGWYASAIADTINTVDSYGRFNLTIQLAATSGGTIISQGIFDVFVYSDIQASSGGGGGFLDSSEQGNDFRDLQ